MAEQREPQLVQSLERGLVALEMALDGGVRSTDLASVLGTDRSTAYRLLNTLLSKGYLIQKATTREFVPNTKKFFDLYNKVVASMDWVEVTAGFLETLREQSGETANLGVLQESNVVYIAHRLGQSALIVNFSLGTSRPLYCSALGKVLLAAQPEAERERLLSKQAFTANTPRTITDLSVLKEQLSLVRKQGYAIDDEETFEGVRCIAAPVYNYLDQVIASIGISGPSTRVTVGNIPKLSQNVIDVARQVSAALGAAGFPNSDGSPHKSAR